MKARTDFFLESLIVTFHNTTTLDLRGGTIIQYIVTHDDVTKWEHFLRYWAFVRGIHRSPVESPNKGQWRGALIFSLVCVWTNSWANNRGACDFRRHRAHYDVTVMLRRIQCILVTPIYIQLANHTHDKNSWLDVISHTSRMPLQVRTVQQSRFPSWRNVSLLAS